MRRRAAKVGAIAVSSSVCRARAFADTDTCAASLQLQQILVTAQKRAEDPQDTPISIHAYSAEAIEILGSKSSTDLGQTLPNLQISPASGAGNQPMISIRGIGLNTVSSAKYQSGGTDSFTPMQPLWAFDESARWSAFSWRSVGLCISPRGERLRRRFDRIRGSCLQRRLLSADPTEARQQLGLVRPEKVFMRPT